MARKQIIIFGRYPEPGRSKTRLASHLGSYGAADLQRRFTELTVSKARETREKIRLDIRFCFEGGNEQKLRRWLGEDILYSGQVEGDLGTRMRIAFEKAFKEGYQKVLLFGTDIPGFQEGCLGQAFEALGRYDLVLGPSTDGGYWLLGLGKPIDLFENVAWGTDKVLEQTLEIARSRQLTFFELEPVTDIDTIEDLREWDLAESTGLPYLSVVIPTLNEAGHIKKTIEKARNSEAEIIVVDGGSTDGTIDLAAESGVKLVSSPRGRAIQQNHGAGFSKGRVLLFLHADTLLPSDYMDYIYDTLMDPSVLMGAFGFKTDLSGPAIRVIEWIANFRSSRFKLPYGDQAFFMRKATFDSVGGFPEIAIAADLYFARRVSEMGRIATLRIPAITSARRWRSLGIFQVTLINLIIVVGCYLGVPPERLALLYRRYDNDGYNFK